MDIFDAIAKRHSYRGEFLDTPIPPEDLRKIVDAGIHAPSGKNEQTTSFVIVDDPEVLKQLAAIVNRPVCNTAKAMIVCVVDPRPILGDISFAVEDCAAAVENMLLATTALGYASVWLDGVLRFDNIAARVAQRLPSPAPSVRISSPSARPQGVGLSKAQVSFERRAWFNCYGGGGSGTSGQWAVGSGQWAVGQWHAMAVGVAVAVGSRQWAVAWASGQWG